MLKFALFSFNNLIEDKRINWTSISPVWIKIEPIFAQYLLHLFIKFVTSVAVIKQFLAKLDTQYCEKFEEKVNWSL